MIKIGDMFKNQMNDKGKLRELTPDECRYMMYQMYGRASFELIDKLIAYWDNKDQTSQMFRWTLQEIKDKRGVETTFFTN